MFKRYMIVTLLINSSKTYICHTWCVGDRLNLCVVLSQPLIVGTIRPPKSICVG